MFSVLYTVVLKPLPYPDGDRIVRIVSANPESGVARSILTGAEAIQRLPTVNAFAATAYYITSQALTVIVDDVPRQINVVIVSADYFRVFGVAAARGRVITETDTADARPVVVLNDKAWRDLGADADIVGKQLRHLDGSVEVVGVMPEYFGSSDTPLAYQFVQPSRIEAYYGSRRAVNAIARISRDVEFDAAAAELNLRMTAGDQVQGATSDAWRFWMVPLVDEVVGNVRPTLLALTVIAVVILVVATATVTTLMSIRIGRREADIAIERAVGSTPLSVFLAAATEMLILVIVAVAAGWMASFLSIRMVVVWLAGDVLPRSQEVDVFSAPVVTVGLAASMIVLMLALLPMRRILILEPATWLSRYSILQWSSHWFRFLPIISVALTTASLATAVALSVSAVRINSVDVGFVSENIGAVSLVRRQPSDELDTFLRSSMERISALPGVIGTSAVLAGTPASPNFLWSSVKTQEDGQPMQTTVQYVAAGYHDFLGIKLLGGRDIDDTDVAGKQLVAVINETLSRMLFHGLDPIGRRVTQSGTDYEIVGIAADRKNAGLRAPPEPEMTMSIHQWLGPSATVMIKYRQLHPTA